MKKMKKTIPINFTEKEMCALVNDIKLALVLCAKYGSQQTILRKDIVIEIGRAPENENNQD